MPTKFNKERICHQCGGPAKYFYKQWYCTHTRDLKGLCRNKKREDKCESNND